ncbi:MAG: TRAP transporter substrate-binding protein DctP [Rhodobacteraceae bacterium]|nr:TRAP transporter substrate-binding protein DctP [Paracoccaceae bacterium]
MDALRKTAVLIAAFLGAGLANPARAAEQELTLVTAWSNNIDFTKDALLLADAINQAGQGVVHVRHIGGPEVIPQRQMAYALKRGVVDMYFGAATYTIGLAPEADAFLGSALTPMELRANGAFTEIERIWNEKLNAHFLGWHQTGPGLHIFLRGDPELRADGLPKVEGLRIRTTPTYRAFLDAMDTIPVDIPSSDVYTALERGTVDGMAWSATAMETEGFQKFVHARINPGVLQYAMTMQINLDAWNRLSPEARRIIDAQAVQFEIDSRARFLGYAETEWAELQRQGMHGFELSPEAAAKYRALAVEAVWARMAKSVPESVKTLRPLFDPAGAKAANYPN